MNNALNTLFQIIKNSFCKIYFIKGKLENIYIYFEHEFS